MFAVRENNVRNIKSEWLQNGKKKWEKYNKPNASVWWVHIENLLKGTNLSVWIFQILQWWKRIIAFERFIVVSLSMLLSLYSVSTLSITVCILSDCSIIMSPIGTFMGLVYVWGRLQLSNADK